MIMRIMMTLTGFILAMLGAITFMHSDHQVLGLLICVGGIFAMHEGLPTYDQNERLRRYERQHQKWLRGRHE
jgi:uncharacterized membrane protein YidH (DUF202 family)